MDKAERKRRLGDFLARVDEAVRALEGVCRHSLCGPGVKGLIEELLSVVNVPERILLAYREGREKVWEEGWPLE